MKIYIAGQYKRRGELAAHAEQLEELGHQCTSSWLKKSDNEEHEFGLKPVEQHAQQDLWDIDDADAILVFGDGEGTLTRGGKHVEWGYALAHQLEMWIVGEGETIFHSLADEIFEDWDEFVEYLTLVLV